MKQILRHIPVIATLIAASIVTATPAAAKPKGKKVDDFFRSSMSQSFRPSDRAAPQWAQQRISYSKAKSIARSRYPGAEVVDISLNGNTYRVRLVLQNRRIVDVLIDAQSGRIR